MEIVVNAVTFPTVHWTPANSHALANAEGVPNFGTPSRGSGRRRLTAIGNSVTVMVGHREIRDLEGTHRFYRFRTPLRGRHAPFLSGLTVVSRWFHGGFMVVSPGHFGYLLVG